MKIAVFSDLHLTNKNPKFRIDSDGISDLLKAQEEFIDWMCHEVEKNEIDGLLFLGDFTDYSTLDPITATVANRVVSRLVQLRRPTILIGGNHTTADQRARHTVLGAISELVSEHDHVHFVTQKTQIPMTDDETMYWFHCFPYMSDLDELKRQIVETNEIVKNSTASAWGNIMLFHFPIVNAQLDNGLKSPHGMELRQEDISGFDMVLGGDFHCPQKIEGLTNAYYVGAPFDFKYNERTEKPRGFAVVDTDDYSIEWHQNPCWYKMVSMPAEEISIKWIDSLGFGEPEQMILRVKGDLDPVLKRELESLDLYRFSHIRSRVTKTKKIDFMVIDSQKDEQMLDEALDKYDEDSDIKDRARELFGVVKGRTK